MSRVRWIVFIYTFGLWCVVSCEWLQHGCHESAGSCSLTYTCFQMLVWVAVCSSCGYYTDVTSPLDRVHLRSEICGVLLAMRGLQHGCHESAGSCSFTHLGYGVLLAASGYNTGVMSPLDRVHLHIPVFHALVSMWCVVSCERLLHGCHESAGSCLSTHLGCGVLLAVSGYYTGVTSPLDRVHLHIPVI
jgi:hypothetical protein